MEEGQDDEFGRPPDAASEFPHDSVEGLLAEAPSGVCALEMGLKTSIENVH